MFMFYKTNKIVTWLYVGDLLWVGFKVGGLVVLVGIFLSFLSAIYSVGFNCGVAVCPSWSLKPYASCPGR